jgi:two-component system KDP operon response regulator KdpE
MMTNQTTDILIIDDDERMIRLLHSLLSAQGYQVRAARKGQDGLQMAGAETPNLVLLDLSLPDISGIEVCRTLRGWLTAPVLVLSANEQDHVKITALDLGADDYLTKPFSTGELLARVRALLRRAAATAPGEPVRTFGDLTVDLTQRRVVLAGCELTLTPTEFALLAVLVKHAGCPVTSRMLLEQVWGQESIDDLQTLRVHISNLRRKLAPLPDSPAFITTLPRVGFRFDA